MRSAKHLAERGSARRVGRRARHRRCGSSRRARRRRHDDRRARQRRRRRVSRAPRGPVRAGRRARRRARQHVPDAACTAARARSSQRNPLIAALADAVDRRRGRRRSSGSLSTARAARRARAGSSRACPGSRGCDRAARGRRGARRDRRGCAAALAGAPRLPAPPSRSMRRLPVRDAIAAGARGIDSIVRDTGLPVRAVLRALPQLESSARLLVTKKKTPPKKPSRCQEAKRGKAKAARPRPEGGKAEEGARRRKAKAAKAEPRARAQGRRSRQASEGREGSEGRQEARGRGRGDVEEAAPKKPKKVKPGSALVVVESPAKARTINKYLGANYIVKASVGHVRDLPKSKIGVDIEDGTFEPVYEVIEGKKKVARRDPQGGARGRDRLPRIRPRSRGRSDRVAHRRGDQGRQHEPPARPDQRDHEEGRDRGDRRAARRST